jgi:deferrochelatase/peroxidase EfeB
MTTAERSARRLTRRRLLALAGMTSAGAAVAAIGTRDESAEGFGAPRESVVPFYGPHQAGIVTPAQDRMHVAAFDVVTSQRAEVRDLLRDWTDAAALLCAGQPVGAVAGADYAPPADTGEALDLTPARLTITIGFGATLFEHDGRDRFGLACQRPAPLIDVPAFAGDSLDPARCGGDLVVQACADDPQVAFHAVRNLARIGRGVVAMRWSQLGFGRTSSTSSAQATPRNLFGFMDGTNNPKLEDRALLGEHVWVAPSDEPNWLRGGTYMVTRRIRMLIEVWDRSSLRDQEQTIGRAKLSGAPLGSRREHDALELDATDASGAPVIPATAHVRLAHPDTNGGVRLLRRGYSFTDGMDAATGQLDAGLFFIAFQRDPRRQFVPIQQRLAASDGLNEYVKHTGSALFAVPPGVAQGGFIGERLFQS